MIYQACENQEKVTEEYTNKAGATNEIVSGPIKEYKMYSRQFNDLTKTLEKMLAERRPETPKEDDPLKAMLSRNRK